jgi:hypothetical protein
VYAVNPMAASRYRERHTTSRAKSDPGDAKVLADLVRTDRHNHREVAGDSDLGEAVKVLARGHQSLIWTRQRQTNALRNALREFYPGALQAFSELGAAETCAVLAAAPTPEVGRSLSQARIIRLLRAGGRQRNLERRAAEIHEALRSPQLEAPPVVAGAYGEVVRSLAGVIVGLTRQIERLEAELATRFEMHPDAEIILSLPGLDRSSAPGRSASSGTTRTAMRMLRPGSATREAPRSPRRRAHVWWCWPGWPATSGSPTPATSGPSPPSPPHRGPASLQLPENERQDPPPSAPGAGEPPRRHPPRLPPPPTALPRGRCLADRGGGSRLTS